MRLPLEVLIMILIRLPYATVFSLGVRAIIEPVLVTKVNSQHILTSPDLKYLNRYPETFDRLLRMKTPCNKEEDVLNLKEICGACSHLSSLTLSISDSCLEGIRRNRELLWPLRHMELAVRSRDTMSLLAQVCREYPQL